MAAFEQHFIGRQVKARYQVAAVEDIIAQNRAGIGDAHGVKSRPEGLQESGVPWHTVGQIPQKCKET